MIISGILLLLLHSSLACQASTSPSFNRPRNGFIENKGQIIDQNNNPNPAVLFLLNTPGMNVQLRRGGFSYDLYRISNIEQRISKDEREYDKHSGIGTGGEVHLHRIDFDLAGTNPGCEIVSSGSSSGWLNYYTTGTTVEGATFVHSYQTVTCRNIYPKIDLEFQTDPKSGVKYNFIVHPGGTLSAIRIKITGPDIDLSNLGYLILATSVGTMMPSLPNSHPMACVYGEPIMAEVMLTGAMVVRPTPRAMFTLPV